LNDVWRERQSFRVFLLAAVFLLWAIVVGLTGGFFFSIGPVRVSSRGMRNALIGCSLCIAMAWALAPPGRRRQIFLEVVDRLTSPLAAAVTAIDRRVRTRLMDTLTVAIAVAVVGVGITKGSFVAGGSDSYGYVSQAHRWVTGTLRVNPPLDVTLPDNLSHRIVVPLGYRLGSDGRASVPTYAPGFPLQMALFERVAGPDAVFYVMPVLAGVTILATYLMGIAVAGRVVGLLAAAFMAMSPTFVFQLTHAPMSDIAAACWWTLALVLLPRGSRVAALLMGLCVALAIATRPNLAPLAIVPWRMAAQGSGHECQPRIARDATGALCHRSCQREPVHRRTQSLLVRIGGESGYGALAGELFRWSYFWPNIVNYSRSLLTTQTPGVVLALAGPVLVWSPLALAYVLFVVVIYLCYAVYLPMEVWWGLRFFLQVFPIMFVFLSVAVVRLPAFLPIGTRVLSSIVIAALMCFGAGGFMRDMGALDSSAERRFADIGRYRR
jgi:hypothetical protein